MKATDVLNLPWKKVDNWSDLSASCLGKSGKDYFYYVSELDFDLFIENLIRDISRKLEVPYEDLQDIIKKTKFCFLFIKIISLF